MLKTPRVLVALAISISAAAAGVHAAGPYRITIAAVAMTPRNASEHNNAASTQCSQQAFPGAGEEEKGKMLAARGSYFAPVVMPHGATVTKVSLFARDNQTDRIIGYLVRKALVVGDVNAGYVTMATASSSGMNNAMKRFDDTTITSPTVNDEHAYFVEILVCNPLATENDLNPVAIQVTYTTP